MIVLAAGCGRFGFDADDHAPSDATASDAAVFDAVPIGGSCVADVECGRCARCDGTCQVEPVTNLFLGHRSTCYIGAGGTRWCTGSNVNGQLGLGDMVDRSLPERANDGGQWQRIFMTYYGHSTGVRNGHYFWWGGGGSLVPVDNGPATDIKAELGDLSPECDWELDGTAAGCGGGATVWHSIDAGADHTCGVRESDRTLWCWGTSYGNDLGISGTVEGSVIANPTQVGTATNWEQVGTGGNSVDPKGVTCALDATGQIYCFGYPTLTGTNGVDVGDTPTLISPDTDWAWLDLDWEHACAGKTDESVWCWGSDTYGGYVAPGLQSAPTPTRIPGTFQRWLMGGHHACGQTNGRWQCMGWNEQGQLGDGTTSGTGNLVDLCP